LNIPNNYSNGDKIWQIQIKRKIKKDKNKKIKNKPGLDC
jgi:hypothetical protein